MSEVVKAVRLNLMKPTSKKTAAFRETARNYVAAVNLCKEAVEFWDGFTEERMTRVNLHKVIYKTLRTKLPAQLAVDAISDAWAGRRYPSARIRNLAVSFNVPRSGNLGRTKRENPIVRVKLDRIRYAIPIAQDGAWKRFERHLACGWKYSHFRMTNYGDDWGLSIALRKDVPLRVTHGTIGIDVGSRTLASISEVVGNHPTRQLYLGRDVGAVQQCILRRRSVLQSRTEKGSRRAARSFARLKGYEANFNKTRCYQVAHQIVNMAVENNRSISIENLNHLRDSKLNRAANRVAKRMPYQVFRAALEHVASQSGIPVVIVPAANTSRTCPRCGHISKENRRGSLFRCVRCDFTVDADRGASVNIARRGLSLERQVDILADSAVRQNSSDGGRVNGPARSHDGSMSPGSRPAQPPEFKPLVSMGGS